MFMNDITISPFLESDLESLPELQPEGWNDLRIPFRYFIQSSFCRPYKAVLNGKVIGLGNSLSHRDTVWLSSVIVHPNYRNQGLGKQITQFLVDDVKGFTDSIYLDATEFGYPVYSRLGFEIETEYVHLRGAAQQLDLSADIVPYQPEHAAGILQLDQRITGEEREAVLMEQIAQSFVYLQHNQVQGVYFPTLRDGFIIADSPQAGIELMKLRLQSFDFAIFPQDNTVALNLVKSYGFVPYRSSKRMRLGKQRSWQPQQVYNRISGALG